MNAPTTAAEVRGQFPFGNATQPQAPQLLPGVQIVDARSNSAPIILVIAAEKAGKCLRGDTKILQTNGTMRTIAELVREQKAEVITMGVAGTLRAAIPTRYFENEMKRLFRLTTQTGRSIDATENHLFLTRAGWVALKDLLAGRDRVAVVVNYPMRDQGSGARLISGGGKMEHAPVDFATQLDRLGDILFDRIVSIEYVASEPTFDFEIAETHNFVANDFVVHNSSIAATTLVNYPEQGKHPLVLAWDKTGPDACIRLGYQPYAMKIQDLPGKKYWDKARVALDNLEKNQSMLHGMHGAIITDCMSTMVDRLHEDARRFSPNPNPMSHFGDALMQSKEWINRLVDLGLPTIFLAWLRAPEMYETTAPNGQKVKKFEMGGPNIMGNTRALIAGKAHHIVYLEKVKQGIGTAGADDEGYVRIFHTKPYENINCHGRYSHVLPEPCPAHLGFVLGCITGRGPFVSSPTQPQGQR